MSVAEGTGLVLTRDAVWALADKPRGSWTSDDMMALIRSHEALRAALADKRSSHHDRREARREIDVTPTLEVEVNRLRRYMLRREAARSGVVRV